MTRLRRDARPPRRAVQTTYRYDRPGPRQSACEPGAGLRPPTRPHRRRRRNGRVALAIGGAVLLSATMLVALLTSNGNGTRASGTGSADAAASTTARREPTPLIATYESIDVRIPVDPSSATVVAFHQASYASALHLESALPETDADMLADAVKNGEGPSSWDGSCIRLWRTGRSGLPNSAIDVGTIPGTEVYAPVTGVVTDVKAYKLYQKYDDYEIHIRVDGSDKIEAVMIHVDDVVVNVGDRVVAGVTLVAAARELSDKMDLQLAGYTSNGGDHVHVQLNTIDAPGAPVTTDGS